jgi:hypothetical protein
MYQSEIRSFSHVPEIRSFSGNAPSVITGIRSAYGASEPYTRLSQTALDTLGRGVELYGSGLHPDTHMADPLGETLSHPPFSSFHPGQIGTYGTYGREGASEIGQSMRYGRDDTQNVTRRDNKRPKERSRDRAYKTRFSMDFTDMPSMPDRSPIPPVGGNTWPREEGFVPSRPVVSVAFGPAQSPVSPLLLQSAPRQDGRSHLSQGTLFEISLIYEGNSVSHRVWPTMAIAQLMTDAGAIFFAESGRDCVVTILGFSGHTPERCVNLRATTCPPRIEGDGFLCPWLGSCQEPWRSSVRASPRACRPPTLSGF